MFFHILGSIAEFEHALVSERTVDGLAAAPAPPGPGPPVASRSPVRGVGGRTQWPASWPCLNGACPQ
ncbi:hypothetical protein QRX50_35665 [Amycolatopsis carbonis]|uniref:Resolvase/invertase-type recombinase catalytic domain-containing protein n=1 Tax=Amycolatopsis carbonis TaxID=715471 RepID=A0A9Y2IRV5_9PSEU|nr:hypothetical protein [Amycolatopsis sp. 2-15]WIX84120.1 hypothetical protein QRX50_35665 [Amycolatopsis sp. 2-15]